MFSKTQLISQTIQLKPNSMIKLMLKASICHKSELPPKKVYRWPYETTSYHLFNFLWDPFSKKKFDENSKIILIEGNIAAGKEDFGKRLADQLGMYYMPEVDLNSYYVNDYGYDYRALNPLLPERMRNCDWEMFHENPSRHSVIHMQSFLFKLRVHQYVKALQHLFNTGQGVILNRSCFTERVFVEAMHNVGWLPLGYMRSDGFRFYDWKIRYNYIRGLTLNTLLKPHLTIYLETPVETCLQRTKESQDPMIANSKAIVPEFLHEIETAYNDIILPKMENNGLLVKYSYPERFTDDEMMDVVEDLKRLDFTYDHHDTRFEDWDDECERFWYTKTRMSVTKNGTAAVFQLANVEYYDIAGLGDSITQIDLKLRHALYCGHLKPFWKDINTNLKYTNFFKALTDYANFGKRFDKALRSDFV